MPMNQCFLPLSFFFNSPGESYKDAHLRTNKLECFQTWKWKWSHSVVSDSLWPVDCSPCYSPPSMGFSRQEYWSGLSFPSPGDDRTQVSHMAGRGFNLCATREALKYKNTVSQKTSYRDTELQIQVLTSKMSREERKPGWKKGEEANIH